MTTAIIIAGGSGARMGQDIPKQFINVYDKPVLIYTLEGFQKHPQIDAIEVVCIDGWHDVVWAYAKQFNITKLKWIVSGGNSGQESIRNGVYNLEDKVSPDDIIIIHDGIRPLVDETVLTDVILKAQKYGNAVTSLPYNEQIFVIDDEISTTKFIPRETLRRVSTPQAYKFDLLDSNYSNRYGAYAICSCIMVSTMYVFDISYIRPYFKTEMEIQGSNCDNCRSYRGTVFVLFGYYVAIYIRAIYSCLIIYADR